MQRFSRLYFELDETTRTAEKEAALVRYFREAPPADAAWGLYFLTERRIKRAVSATVLRQWVGEAAGLPAWLVDESYDAVGDLGETMALLLPGAGTKEGDFVGLSLSELVERRLVPMRRMSDDQKREMMIATWNELGSPERLVWHRLILGNFRVGVARTLVVRALASVSGVEPAVMAHRLMGGWQPTEAAFRALISAEDQAAAVSRPYPFYLAHALDGPPESLGAPEDWQVEWKWDGIRAQIIHRAGQVFVWSRGEELISDGFPEMRAIGEALPIGTVLDGEIVAWEDGRPLPFQTLQLRIGRKRQEATLFDDVPVAFIAYDVLEHAGVDVRNNPLSQRRVILDELIHQLGDTACRRSPVLVVSAWDDVRRFQQRAREETAEGLMLKRKDSPYGVGRQKGAWWKWKVDPYTVDAVLIHAQQGHGRRASLFTDYTFGVWHDGELVPVAKAYSGLTDEEIRHVDAFIRKNTTGRSGPVRRVTPELVFELAFEGIQASPRHKSGIALRFPRMARWRTDKKPQEADSLETLRSLLRTVTPAQRGF